MVMVVAVNVTRIDPRSAARLIVKRRICGTVSDNPLGVGIQEIKAGVKSSRISESPSAI